MTPRQQSYLTHLVAEREQALVALSLQADRVPGAQSPDDRAVYRDAAKASFLLAWYRAETQGGTQHRGMNPRQASEAISWLLDGVSRDDRPADGHEAAPAVDVPAGRYAIVTDDGTVKFYRVDRPTEGRWAGYTFVKVQASEEWHRVARNAQAPVLAAIAEDPIGAMRRYGLELGRCGNCGRLLTDETSRAHGIGPDCAERLGLDRSPYAAQAAAERLARLREIADEPRPIADPLNDDVDAERQSEMRDGEYDLPPLVGEDI
jgi:hypothetical protein